MVIFIRRIEDKFEVTEELLSLCPMQLELQQTIVLIVVLLIIFLIVCVCMCVCVSECLSVRRPCKAIVTSGISLRPV